MSRSGRVGPWLAFATKGLVRRVAVVAAFLGIALTGTMVGAGLAGPAPKIAMAQDGGTPFCEDDACIFLERSLWFDYRGCADAPDSDGGCAWDGDECDNCECGA